MKRLTIRPDSVLPSKKCLRYERDGKKFEAQCLNDLFFKVKESFPSIRREEVFDQAMLVERDEKGLELATAVAVMSVSSSVVYTVTRLLIDAARARGGRKMLVDRAEAERRAAICVRCPMNMHVPCMSCFGIKVLGATIFRGAETPYDYLLASCGICRCYNSYQIWCRAETLQDIARRTGMTAELYPNNCWKKEILGEKSI